MDILTKLKSIERWQKDPNLKKFKCTKEHHKNLIPVIIKDEVLMKCPTCKKLYKPLSEAAFQYGHMLLLQDKKKKKEKK